MATLYSLSGKNFLYHLSFLVTIYILLIIYFSLFKLLDYCPLALALVYCFVIAFKYLGIIQYKQSGKVEKQN